MRVSPAPLSKRSRIREAACLLIAGAAAGAGAAGVGDTETADVEFDGTLLQNTGAQIDVSRFNGRNVALPGTYRAEVHVNQVWLGRFDVSLREVGGDRRNVQPCFDRAFLERIGVDLDRLTAQAVGRLDEGGGACVPLSALVEGAAASFDIGEQRLDVGIPQALMAHQPRGYVDPKYWDDGVNAGLLQYQGNVFRSESHGVASTQGYLGLEGGLNVGAWRLRHRGNYTHEEQTGNRYQGVQTSLQRSLIGLKSKLVLGDAFTEGAMFDSVGFRGIQLASDDRMLPQSQRGYAPVVRGIARSNARVQIRQNGNLLYETTVAPGPFEINDLYPTGYGGDLEVTLTEADGSLHVSRVPFTAIVNALRPGSTRYSLTAGQFRGATGDFKPYLVEGTVQHGFSNQVTGYGGAVLSKDYAAAGVGVALNTNYGAVGVDLTHATTQLLEQPSRSGQSLRLSYSKLLEPTQTNLTVAAYRYSTRGYLGLADAMAVCELQENGGPFVAQDVQRARFELMLNQSLSKGYGDVYLSGSVRDYWSRSGRDLQLQAGYGNSYGRIAYGLSLARQLDPGSGRWENRLTFNVNIPLGDGPNTPYATTEVQRDSSGRSSLRESVTGSLGRDHALAYGLNVARTSDADRAGDRSVGGNVSYASPMATFSASASNGTDYSQLSAGVSGGLVAYSGGVAFAPSLGETVAVVEARDAAGARLAGGTGLRVDPWGHGLVPNLTPFARNPIEIDPQGLPMNIELKSTLQMAAPTAGAVVKMKFETENLGRTAIIDATRFDGKPLPFGAEVRDASGRTVGTVAQGGRILARGLKEDSGVLTIILDAERRRECRLPYHLPAGPGARADAPVMTSGICSDLIDVHESRPAPEVVSGVHPR
ncbi:fimbrial biogenesis outer membrane usher protein [Ramlibacter monticola]|uniref:Fimbrial biogenesis outer membrane usher protein n=1 Tax=Ramlibacter monticola TaxID=1926872 RepID=A0A936Z0L6_9BURK|nr:fimbria/pilus outer membrane usher protein [Ramlibacter monticola]MBL0391889.1 fimbrial biogenesis outer membrane usher protein [Ramlibacter monticola]